MILTNAVVVSVKYAPPVADRLAEEKAKPYPEGAPRFRSALYALARRCGLGKQEAVKYATMSTRNTGCDHEGDFDLAG